VVFVEYRKEDAAVAIKEVHKMTVRQLEKEMNAVGLMRVRTVETLPLSILLYSGRAIRLSIRTELTNRQPASRIAAQRASLSADLLGSILFMPSMNRIAITGLLVVFWRCRSSPLKGTS